MINSDVGNTSERQVLRSALGPDHPSRRIPEAVADIPKAAYGEARAQMKTEFRIVYK